MQGILDEEGRGLGAPKKRDKAPKKVRQIVKDIATTAHSVGFTFCRSGLLDGSLAFQGISFCLAGQH
jgi:hypothetical protein